MKIHVQKLKSQLANLNQLLASYEENMKNYYYQLLCAKDFWTDVNSQAYFENVRLEEIDVSVNYSKMKELSDLYASIVKDYEKYGDNIDVTMESKDQVINSINRYIKKITDVINDYNNLDLSFLENEKNIILKEKKQLIIVKNDLLKLKKKISKFFNEIEKFEKTLTNSLAKFELVDVKENDNII